MPASSPNCTCNSITSQVQTYPSVVYYDLLSDSIPIIDPDNTAIGAVYFKQTKIFLWDIVNQKWVQR